MTSRSARKAGRRWPSRSGPSRERSRERGRGVGARPGAESGSNPPRTGSVRPVTSYSSGLTGRPGKGSIAANPRASCAGTSVISGNRAARLRFGADAGDPARRGDYDGRRVSTARIRPRRAHPPGRPGGAAPPAPGRDRDRRPARAPIGRLRARPRGGGLRSGANAPLRQWVLSLPRELRGLAAMKADVFGAVERIFAEEIARATKRLAGVAAAARSDRRSSCRAAALSRGYLWPPTARQSLIGPLVAWRTHSQ